MLGPVTLAVDGSVVDIGPPMVRQLLATLLCRAGQPVQVEELIDELWGGGAPPTARKTLQGYVHRLRTALPDPEIVRHGLGNYTLITAGTDLDAHEFATLAARAAAAERQGDPTRTAALGQQALQLWRGPAFADVTAGAIVADEARRLEEERVVVRERLAEAELALGRHVEVAGALPSVIRDHPYRERLRAQLIVALARSGRPAEALEVYRQTYELLTEQLGIAPSAGLQRLHQAVLAGDDRLIRTDSEPERVVSTPEPALAGPPAPRELPAEIVGFTGRERELATLRRMTPDGPRTVVVSALDGFAGVGKTALAIRWAQEIADQFPDGQLFIDLRGYSSLPPLRPLEALAAMLRSLGISSDKIPLAETEAAALYRSRMAGRQMLVLLDNARSAEQVRPLLPGGTRSLVVVTSRDWLGGLVAREGAQHLAVDVLTPEEARALLVGSLGPQREQAEPEAVTELAQLCGFLPLALRIAAAQLHHYPHRTVAEQVAALRKDRLAELAVEGDERSAVRIAFDQSYQGLPAPAQRLFGWLGLVPGDDIDLDAAAALAALDRPATARILDRLVTAHLVAPQPGGRYRLHDLLREYAGALAAAEPTHARARLYQFYVDRLDAAARAAYPTVIRLPGPASAEEFADRDAAIAWLDAERGNLAAVVAAAAAQGDHQTSTRIAHGLHGYLFLRRDAHGLLTVATTALAAAVAAGDELGQAALYLGCTHGHLLLNEFAAATNDINAAAALSAAIGWWLGSGQAEMMASRLHLYAGDLARATLHAERSFAAYDRTGHISGQAISLARVGLGHLLTGRLADAHDYQRRAPCGPYSHPMPELRGGRAP